MLNNADIITLQIGARVKNGQLHYILFSALSNQPKFTHAHPIQKVLEFNFNIWMTQVPDFFTYHLGF
jgi:hypothetical protein